MRICTRTKAPSYGCYLCFCRQRHPCSCLCGLHKQAPRAQGRSSVAPPKSALQLHAPASRRVPHSVSQPTPPQGTPAPATDPRRHGLSNSVAPAARKRSASAAAGACCAVTLRTAPCPLRGHCAGSASPLAGSCSAGEEKNEKDAHPRTSTSAFSHSGDKLLITPRRSARTVAPCPEAFHAEKNTRNPPCGKPRSRSARWPHGAVAALVS